MVDLVLGTAVFALFLLVGMLAYKAGQHENRIDALERDVDALYPPRE